MNRRTLYDALAARVSDALRTETNAAVMAAAIDTLVTLAMSQDLTIDDLVECVEARWEGARATLHPTLTLVEGDATERHG